MCWVGFYRPELGAARNAFCRLVHCTLRNLNCTGDAGTVFTVKTITLMSAVAVELAKF